MLQNIKSFYLVLFAGILLFAAPSQADVAFDVTGGALKDLQNSQFHLDVEAHIWYKFDQMVFLGIGGGVQKYKDTQNFPVTLATSIRLPIGGQTLPVVIGEWGRAFSPAKDYFIWKAGAGLDIKNGDRTSILLLAGYQDTGTVRGNALFLRAGLLLEF